MRELQLPELDTVSGAGQSESPFGSQNIGGTGGGASNVIGVAWTITSNGNYLNSGVYYFDADNDETDGISIGNPDDSDVLVQYEIEDPDCPEQMLIAGVMLDKSIVGLAGVELGLAMEVAGVNADNDIWLVGSAGVGFDLTEISGAEVFQILSSMGGVGVSGFVESMSTDESGGNFQMGVQGSMFGLGFSADDTTLDCGPGVGGTAGAAMFSTSVSGDFALNLTEMSISLGMSVEQMLNDWENSITQYKQISSDQFFDGMKDLFTPPDLGSRAYEGMQEIFRDTPNIPE